ncbi:protein of unknown function (DUF3506) [Geosmithia morbida]|uniref:F-box domain-containing protein n=1 Tax=Geosmithia morbida TaxID=1094350 RepID=A0A9P4YSV9_9HYPO|nr:protein of unknown function (DUF3506) [Geosmithia morbida]KAF4120389.1 protein of unknown function (DUF3506) [Geosmithia morbida]
MESLAQSPLPGASTLLELPVELIDGILSCLSPYDLCSVSATCHTLRHHALSDVLWRPIVQSNVPGSTVRSPHPCESFQRLYAEHDRLWFLPKYKIWFCDRDLPGKLILVRYDDRRGCIEGFELLAVSKRTRYEAWSANNQVMIHSFEPTVRLHVDKPILQFKVGDRDEDGGFSTRPEANRFADEIPMVLDDRLQHMYSNFLLNKPLSQEEAEMSLVEDYPYGSIWPPPAVPARQHARGMRSGQYSQWLRTYDRPRRRCEVSDQTFSIRRWIQMGGAVHSPVGMGLDRVGSVAGSIPISDMTGRQPGGAIGAHIGEEVMTFSTLDPELYKPTPTRPWRGIWVGDYSGHGCEFLLINQPDEPEATDEELHLIREEGESDETWERRRMDARIYRGRLGAIKLTGDPNVPRGEYTFAADDLGPDGFVGLASEPPFEGVRVVRSKGHIAHTGFIQDRFIESQLLLLGPDRLAQYWVGFGHISFFERVNIDDHLDPNMSR